MSGMWKDSYLKLRDVRAHVGVMVCPLGYTQSAMNLARAGMVATFILRC